MGEEIWSHTSSAPQSRGFCCFPKTQQSWDGTLVTHLIQKRSLGCTGELEGFEAGIPEDLEGAGNPLPATIQPGSHTSPFQCCAGAGPFPGAPKQALDLLLEPGFCGGAASWDSRDRVCGWNSFRISNSIPAFGNHWVSSRCREGSRAPAVWGKPTQTWTLTRIPFPPHGTHLQLVLPAGWKNLETPLGIPIPFQRRRNNPAPTPPTAPTVEFAWKCPRCLPNPPLFGAVVAPTSLSSCPSTPRRVRTCTQI